MSRVGCARASELVLPVDWAARLLWADLPLLSAWASHQRKARLPLRTLLAGACDAHEHEPSAPARPSVPAQEQKQEPEDQPKFNPEILPQVSTD